MVMEQIANLSTGNCRRGSNPRLSAKFMFSIDLDKNIISEVSYVNFNHLHPHENIIPEKRDSLKHKLQKGTNFFFISSIIICNKSGIIIDGHHRYSSLKEIGISQIPVTKVNYMSKKIITTEKNIIPKRSIIKRALSGNLFDPKSTKHMVFCEKKNDWFPIILISSLFQIKL